MLIFEILYFIGNSGTFSTVKKMASSGKKGRKNKGTVISLQSFLSNGDTPLGTTQVAKKIRNVDGDDSDDGSNSLPLIYQLPTAPRANRIFDDDSIPHKPPFIAYITNLPFDANGDDIYAFFGSIAIVSLRLPREDGDSGRVRGFGYVEFESRDDLIHVLSLPDPCIKGRRIRIELSNENEQQNNRQRGNRRNYEGLGNNSENRESTNWRRDSQHEDTGVGNTDRRFNRERKSDQNEGPGSWRTGSRSFAEDVSPRRDRRDRRDDRQRDISGRNRNFDRDDREKNIRRIEDPSEERPKLNLKPRTLPLPEIVTKAEIEDEPTKTVKPSGAAPEKVFGSAKPVDTAARELEIEERLAEARRQEKIRWEKEDGNISEQLEDMHLEKTQKEDTNSAISWRRRIDSSTNNKRDVRKGSPEKSGFSKQDDHDSKDVNRYSKNRDKGDRLQQSNDGKHKDESRAKRDTKPERPLPKHQANQSEPVLQSSNMYSGLDEEASD